MCSYKSTGGTARCTPVGPPVAHATVRPTSDSIVVADTLRTRNIDPNKRKNLRSIGTAMIDDMMPKEVLTSAHVPSVKKWCSQTSIERTEIPRVASTIER